jgi:ABC-type nickel/cobalt efflux system permease component RcnA
VSSGAHRITFDDATFPERIGWKDIVVAPATEPTDDLRRYPSALIGSPRDRTSIAFAVDSAGHVAVANENRPASTAPSAARMNALSDMLNRNFDDPLVAIAALLFAIVLGALHALEPGHGKSLLAITLVGARATVRQAATLAGALTVAHTAGVLAFGAVLLCFARFIVPEAFYPWIALGSGVTVLAIGARAIVRTLALRHDHPHAPAHDHHDHDHDHAHDHHHHDHAQLDDAAHARAHAIAGHAPLTFGSAIAAAMAGNIAPCPAALVVLLAAVATHRLAIGMVLIVAFSLGLALTLTVLGFAVVRSAGWLMRRRGFDRLGRAAPLLSAGAMCAAGTWMIVTSPFSWATIGALALTGLVLVAGPSLVRRLAVRTSIGGAHS